MHERHNKQLTQVGVEQLSTLDQITLAVNLEPAAGSPTSQSTGTVLYAGVVTVAQNKSKQ